MCITATTYCRSFTQLASPTLAELPGNGLFKPDLRSGDTSGQKLDEVSGLDDDIGVPGLAGCSDCHTALHQVELTANPHLLQGPGHRRPHLTKILLWGCQGCQGQQQQAQQSAYKQQAKCSVLNASFTTAVLM
jgi:hypothetical protein